MADRGGGRPEQRHVAGRTAGASEGQHFRHGQADPPAGPRQPRDAGQIPPLPAGPRHQDEAAVRGCGGGGG